MENAVNALKIAFAVMVFTMALTLAISTFSQARETAEAVLFMNDKTNYYQYEIAEEHTDASGNIYYETSDGIKYTNERKVGIESIIPTLYRYYKENYTVIFELEDTANPIYVLDSTDKWDKDYTPINDDDKIYYFDLNSEISRNCPWVGTVNDIKKNMDLFLDGTTGYNFGNTSREVKYNGFMDTYKNATFLEQLGEYSTDRNYGIETDINGHKWLVIGNEKYKFDSTNGRVNPKKYPETGWDDVPSMGITNFLNTYYPNEDDLNIGNNATTQWNEDTDWEIIELAKPTIKRVIKYTLVENNP